MDSMKTGCVLEAPIPGDRSVCHGLSRRYSLKACHTNGELFTSCLAAEKLQIQTEAYQAPQEWSVPACHARAECPPVKAIC